jgi:poly-gamma-glutamate capsule biosynthesis protein CapA/YwtB (metallophosphatase superfamily)
LGAHAHVLQSVEHYGDGLIAYGLGNFVFDGFAIPSNYTAIFRAQISLHGVESYDWVPVVVDHGLPRLATPEEAAQILPRVQE